MTSNFSYFNAPIRNVIPCGALTVDKVHRMIVSDDHLRQVTLMGRNLQGDDFRRYKSQWFPYVTPCGEFRRRRADELCRLSGLVVVDIDHLESLEEAERLRDRLFDDPWLRPELTFVSPSGRGVKAFVNYVVGRPATDGLVSEDRWDQEGFQPTEEHVRLLSATIVDTMRYVDLVYGSTTASKTRKDVDFSGRDVSRACFLSHDEGAKLRQ